MNRPMIIHNAYTCTSLLTYTRIYSKHRQSLCQWMGCLRGGGNIYIVSSFRMITDKVLTEMPFGDVARIEILDNNERNNADNDVYNMSTNNDCLMGTIIHYKIVL